MQYNAMNDFFLEYIDWSECEFIEIIYLCRYTYFETEQPNDMQ